MNFYPKLLFSLCFSFFVTFSINGQTVGQPYVFQNGDWLSKVSKRAYGNPHLYYQIIEGTNEKAQADNSYIPITSVNKIQVGQKVWIPKQVGASTEVTAPKAEEEAILVALPKTNCDIRVWYNYQVIAIGKLNEKWAQDGLDLAERAHKAYELRHNARINARFMMQNKTEVEGIQARDLGKYGNPDGPTYDYLVKKSTDKGLSKEAAYKNIIASSSRVSPVFNAKCK